MERMSGETEGIAVHERFSHHYANWSGTKWALQCFPFVLETSRFTLFARY
eukprot:UN12774